MAKIKQLYLALDGTEFDVEADADAHDAFLAAENSIEAYITHADLKKAQAGLMRRHLSGYIAFQEQEDYQNLIMEAGERVAGEKAAAAAEAAKAKAGAKAARAARAAAATVAA